MTKREAMLCEGTSHMDLAFDTSEELLCKVNDWHNSKLFEVIQPTYLRCHG